MAGGTQGRRDSTVGNEFDADFFQWSATRGERRAYVAELLEQLDLEPRYVAVEVNLDLVPRDRHQELVLKAGDRLEVVTLVGGG